MPSLKFLKKMFEQYFVVENRTSLDFGRKKFVEKKNIIENYYHFHNLVGFLEIFSKNFES